MLLQISVILQGFAFFFMYSDWNDLRMKIKGRNKQGSNKIGMINES